MEPVMESMKTVHRATECGIMSLSKYMKITWIWIWIWVISRQGPWLGHHTWG